MKMKSRLTIFLALLLLLLSACGPLDIQIQPLATATIFFPTPLPVIGTPAAAASASLELRAPAGVQGTTATPRVVTATPSLTPAASASPELRAPAGVRGTAEPTPAQRLKPGTAVKIVRTNMLTPLSGWAIGWADPDPTQHILFTLDGGQTWQDRSPFGAIVNSPAEGLSAAAYFASADQAWAAYSSALLRASQEPLVVWRTGDGGKTWEKSQPLDLSGVEQEFQNPSDLAFLDGQHGWLLVHLGVGMNHDYIAIFTSADGGKTWQRVLDPSTTSPLMSCVKSGLTFTVATTAWLTGNCPGLMPKLFFYRSSDGGASWTELTLPVPAGKPANYFAQSSIGCGITAINISSARALSLTLGCSNYTNNSAQSWLYISADGGTSWTARMLPLPYTRIDLLNSNEGLLVGALKPDADAAGAVYHTANGGADWALYTSTAWTGTPDFVDALNGWVVAVHGQVVAFVRSVDGGKIWIEIKPVIGS